MRNSSPNWCGFTSHGSLKKNRPKKHNPNLKISNTDHPSSWITFFPFRPWLFSAVSACKETPRNLIWAGNWFRGELWNSRFSCSESRFFEQSRPETSGFRRFSKGKQANPTLLGFFLQTKIPDVLKPWIFGDNDKTCTQSKGHEIKVWDLFFLPKYGCFQK